MRFLVYCESHDSCEVPRVLWKPRFLWGSSCTVKAMVLVRFLVFCKSHGSCEILRVLWKPRFLYCESHGSCEVPHVLWKPWFLRGSSCTVKATVLVHKKQPAAPPNEEWPLMVVGKQFPNLWIIYMICYFKFVIVMNIYMKFCSLDDNQQSINQLYAQSLLSRNYYKAELIHQCHWLY